MSDTKSPRRLLLKPGEWREDMHVKGVNYRGVTYDLLEPLIRPPAQFPRDLSTTGREKSYMLSS